MSALKTFVLNSLPKHVRGHYSRESKCLNIHSVTFSEHEDKGVAHVFMNDGTFDTWGWLPSNDGSGMSRWTLCAENEAAIPATAAA